MAKVQLSGGGQAALSAITSANVLTTTEIPKS